MMGKSWTVSFNRNINCLQLMAGVISTFSLD